MAAACARWVAFPRGAGGRLLRPAGPQRRGQDLADQHPGGACARHPGQGHRDGPRRGDDYAAARRSLGIVPQELVFDPFFSVREALRIQSGYFGVRRNDAWIDELIASLGLADKADANMRQLSGGMRPRAGGAGAGAPPARDRAGRAHRRRRCRTAADAVAIHLAAEPRGPHGAAHHALSRGGRGAVPARRDAQAGPRGGARAHESTLLAGTVHTMLRFKIDHPLPPHLAPACAHDGALGADQRARCGRSGNLAVAIARMRRTHRGSRDRPRRPRGCVPRDHDGRARRACNESSRVDARAGRAAGRGRSGRRPHEPVDEHPVWAGRCRPAVPQGGAALSEGRLPDGGRARCSRRSCTC